MDDWPEPFSQVFEAIANEAEQLFQGVAKEAIEAVEQLVQISESISDQVEHTITPELERLADQVNQAMKPLDEVITPTLEAVVDRVNDVVEPLFEIWLLDLDQESTLLDTSINQMDDPLSPEHPTCAGCGNYHGQVYGGNLVVCAIHPYGPDMAECPDWESVWRQDENQPLSRPQLGAAVRRRVLTGE